MLQAIADYSPGPEPDFPDWVFATVIIVASGMNRNFLHCHHGGTINIIQIFRNSPADSGCVLLSFKDGSGVSDLFTLERDCRRTSCPSPEHSIP